jgi:Electron transfer DM13
MNFKLLSITAIALLSIVSITSCTKEKTVTVEVPVDSSQPIGAFSATKSGTITAQNMTGSKGAVKLGTDSKGTQFVQFGADFETVLATGTVTVYLSTSETFTASPGTGNPDLRLIGTVTKNGAHNFKLSPVADAKFTHVILWCGTAAVPFGNAKLN